MSLSRRLARDKRIGKPFLVLAIGALSTIAALLVGRSPLQRLNEPLYDEAFRLRPRSDRTDSNVVIVTANEASLTAMAATEQKWGWPWPRQFWGLAIDYVAKCGAKAAAVDLLFPEPSTYNREFGDDTTFAQTVDGVSMPVVYAKELNPDGFWTHFAPPVKKPPKFGAVNLADGATVREYLSTVNGVPSLGLATVRVAGFTPPSWSERSFRLHFYGPHEDKKGHSTFRFVSAARVFEAMQDPDHPEAHGIDLGVFKDKIVLFGTTATGTYDVKSAPLSAIFPGVEVHATAIENLIDFSRVAVVPSEMLAGITALAAALAAVGATAPRRTWMKLLLAGAVAGALVLVAVSLFELPHIVWLPPVGPLTGVFLSVILSLSWSYFAEDRQARFFLRALGQYVSPHVASELKADPEKLAISTEKGELTILFSDIVGFTDLSEELEERVGPLLNYYLDEMSAPVLAQDGTVDKYIGDAIMSFWNAPVPQPDHAARACRAALAMQKRLADIQPQLAALGAPGLAARVGVNTGPCAYGNMGSKAKFNYSVIGDAVNFASRLEGANKIYRTRILIGEATARLVRDSFVLRKVDLLRAKGKLKPVDVFELRGEGPADPAEAALIERYEAAFAAYCKGDWDSAEGPLLDILSAAPEDGPSRELLARIKAFRREPPPVPWTGVFVAKEK